MSIQVGIIGFGLSGKVFHGRLIKQLEGFNVASVFSSRIEEIKEEHPQARIETSWQGLVKNETIDLVVITSPNEFHFEQAKLAMESGKHVLIEKPITTNLEKTLQLIKIAKECKRVLCTFQNRRFDDDFLTVQEILRHSTIKSYKSHFHRYRPQLDKGWRFEKGEARGVFWDLAPHLLDQILVLFGLPDSVKASLKIEREGGKEVDRFDIELQYKNFKAIAEAGSLVQEAGARFEVITDKGVFCSYEMDPQEKWLKNKTKDEVLRKMSYTEKDGELLDFDQKVGSYKNFYQQLGTALEDQGPAPVLLDEIRDLMFLMEACLESSRLKSLVKINRQSLSFA